MMGQSMAGLPGSVAAACQQQYAERRQQQREGDSRAAAGRQPGQQGSRGGGARVAAAVAPATPIGCTLAALQRICCRCGRTMWGKVRGAARCGLCPAPGSCLIPHTQLATSVASCCVWLPLLVGPHAAAADEDDHVVEEEEENEGEEEAGEHGGMVDASEEQDPHM